MYELSCLVYSWFSYKSGSSKIFHSLNTLKRILETVVKRIFLLLAFGRSESITANPSLLYIKITTVLIAIVWD